MGGIWLRVAQWVWATSVVGTGWQRTLCSSEGKFSIEEFVPWEVSGGGYLFCLLSLENHRI